MSSVKENYIKVMEQIVKAAQKAGRNPEEINLVAVSKTVESARIKEAIEARFGLFDRLPHRIGWLSNNGSAYISSATRAFATGVELVVCTTPIGSPESNGVAKAFIKTFKRDYVTLHRSGHPRVILEQLPGWFKDYNENHPYRGLKMMSPKGYRQSLARLAECPVLWG